MSDKTTTTHLSRYYLHGDSLGMEFAIPAAFRGDDVCFRRLQFELSRRFDETCGVRLIQCHRQDIKQLDTDPTPVHRKRRSNGRQRTGRRAGLLLSFRMADIATRSAAVAAAVLQVVAVAIVVVVRELNTETKISVTLLYSRALRQKHTEATRTHPCTHRRVDK